MRSLVMMGLTALAMSPVRGNAEVVTSTPAMFEISQSIAVDKPDTAVWEALRSPQKWWDKAHTYSGDSANLYLDAQATGCFCEKLPGRGSVEHGHIVYVQPPRMLRMRAALGPLQGAAVVGTLTIMLEREGDNATRVVLRYLVSGYVKDGADAVAPKVDEMLAAQLVSLKAAAEATAAAVPAE